MAPPKSKNLIRPESRASRAWTCFLFFSRLATSLSKSNTGLLGLLGLRRKCEVGLIKYAGFKSISGHVDFLAMSVSDVYE